jgi:SNF2 family DNA or RNA helicase
MKTPFPYQVHAVKVGSLRNLLIADDAGLGKTLEAIEIAKVQLRKGGSVLVVCEKNARAQWREAIFDQVPNLQEDDVRTITLDGKTIYEDGKWYIVHWDILKYKGPKLVKFWWRCIIADEAHHICNRKNVWSQALKNIRGLSKVALTATPMDKSPADMWSILHWLYPGAYSSFWKFCDEYVLYEEPKKEIVEYIIKVNGVPKVVQGATNFERPQYRKIIGTKNPERLAWELSRIMVQRTKKQVAPELPPKIYSRIPVAMADDQQELYDAVVYAKDIVVDLEHLNIDNIMVDNVLSRIMRLQQISVDPSLVPGVDGISSSKLEWLDAYIKDNPKEVMIVFSKFRETVVGLAKKYNGALVTGQGKSHGIEDFLEGRNRLLFGTIAAMGTSLNLQRAHTAIFIGQEWSARLMEQAENRIHRIDITEPKHIITLISSPVDKLVMRTVEHKWSEYEMVCKYLKGEDE